MHGHYIPTTLNASNLTSNAYLSGAEILMTIRVDQTSQTISWFNDRLAEQKLIFKPPFQRNPVWLDKHKSYLIDTALRGLPIPEIYMQKETDETGATTYSLVDGQQRVRSLLAFPQGEVELMDSFTPGRGGQTWEDLTTDEKRNYWNYRLVVREISEATDADLRDLFRRLNQNTVTLNSQEIRNARYQGEFIQTATELANQPFWAENRIVTANEIRRMLDIEYVAELLIGIMWGPQNKKTTMDLAFEKYEPELPDKQSWLKRFEEARSTSQRLVIHLGETRWRGKSDYYSLFLAIDTLSQKGRLPRNRQKAATEALLGFGEKVTGQLSKNNIGARSSANVKKYAAAVEKAASDKDRRQSRHEILIKLLSPFYTGG
jgi:hypothetical protein